MQLRIRFWCILLLRFLGFGALNQLSAQTIEELSFQAAAARDVKDFPRELKAVYCASTACGSKTVRSFLTSIACPFGM